MAPAALSEPGALERKAWTVSVSTGVPMPRRFRMTFSMKNSHAR